MLLSLLELATDSPSFEPGHPARRDDGAQPKRAQGLPSGVSGRGRLRYSAMQDDSLTSAVDIFVDETGSVVSDTEARPYGFGYVVLPSGAIADQLRDQVRKSFPKPFHLKEYRKRKKVKAATRLLDLLPDHPLVFGGAHVVSDPEYARKYSYQVVLDTYGRSLEELARHAPLGESGLVETVEDAIPQLFKGGRLYAIWEWALGNPIAAILSSSACPQKVDVRVHFGVAGAESTFNEYLALFGRAYKPNVIEEMQRRGTMPKKDCQVIVDTTGTFDPLFGYADLFAGVAHHAWAKTDVAEELYATAKPFLDRMSWNPAVILRPGISVFPPP